MQYIDREMFAGLVKDQRIKKRLARELRFSPEDVSDWNNLELLAVSTRSANEGLILFEDTQGLYLLPYELTLGLTDKVTGRSKPITCDFCLTWQQGGKAGRIAFRRPSDAHMFVYLCCSDLKCSLHVRNETPESTLSRTQLREDITTEERIVRLKNRFNRVITTLQAEPVSGTIEP